MRVTGLNRKGQILVLVAFLLLVLLGIAALAIDIGRAYGVRTKLNAAVDAASLRAADAMSQGSDETLKIAKARSVATSYFTANYPDDFLGATPSAPSVQAVRNSKTGVWEITVSATAKMPTLFAGLVGWKNLDVSATSQAVRETLDMVLVMDASSSLGGVFNEVKDRSKTFVDHFNELDDRFGLVVFSNGAAPLVSICGETGTVEDPPLPGKDCARGYKKDVVKSAIGSVGAGGTTASAEGLKKAWQQLKSLKKESGKRVIVFFSDGAPNTFNGKFPVGGGATQEGNLYSDYRPLVRPKKIFDAKRYNDYTGNNYAVLSLPETDAAGVVTLESYHKIRALTGRTDDAGLKCDANAAARNMVENVANMAREEGIVIYSLGLGYQLNEREMLDPACSTYNEVGDTIMRRVANTIDSDTYNPAQPAGIYCYARTIDDLGPCYGRLVSAILRISK